MTMFEESYRAWQTSARHAMSFSPREFSDQEIGDAVMHTHVMLRSLAESVIATAKVRDDLTLSKEILITPSEQQAFIESPKMDARFDICADGHSIRLQTRIQYPQHLRRMNDDFFSLLAALEEHGYWSYASNGPRSKGKSSLYRLIVDAEAADDPSDFGALAVTWPYLVPGEEIARLAPAAFAGLHQLQYRLYRAEVQLRAGRKKRNRLSADSPATRERASSPPDAD